MLSIRGIFFNSAKFGSHKTLKFMLSFGYSVNMQDIDNKKTALHYAVEYSSVETIRFLLERSASKYKKDINGNTPLHYAAEQRNLAILSNLFSFYQDFLIVNSSGESPIDIARRHNNIVFIEYYEMFSSLTAKNASQIYINELVKLMHDKEVDLKDAFTCPITFDHIPKKPCAVSGSRRWWQIYESGHLRKCHSDPLTREILDPLDIVPLDANALEKFYEIQKNKLLFNKKPMTCIKGKDLKPV